MGANDLITIRPIYPELRPHRDMVRKIAFRGLGIRITEPGDKVIGSTVARGLLGWIQEGLRSNV